MIPVFFLLKSKEIIQKKDIVPALKIPSDPGHQPQPLFFFNSKGEEGFSVLFYSKRYIIYPNFRHENKTLRNTHPHPFFQFIYNKCGNVRIFWLASWKL